MPTRGIGASTRSRGGRMRSGAEGKFFAVASLAVLAVCMGGSEGSLGSVARVVRLQEAACLRSWGGGGGAMRLRGGGKKQEAEDAKAALLEREIAEGDAVMAEDVTSNCVMREVQDPNEYEPVPVPVHHGWIRELESFFNAKEQDDKDKADGVKSDFYRQMQLKMFLRFPKEGTAEHNTTSPARMLTDWATLKMKARGNFTAAEELFKQAIDADPEYVPALTNYANMLWWRVEGKETRFDEAEELYKKALACTPHDSNVLNNYALFLQVARLDDEGALEYFKKAYEHNPKHETASYHYGKLLLKLKQDKAGYHRLRLEASKHDPEKRWPGLQYSLWKKQHSKGIEVLYECPDPKCVHNVQNEVHQTRSCIKGRWSKKRGKYTLKEKHTKGKWTHYPIPRYDPCKRDAIHKEHATLPGIQVPAQYYTGGKRPSRPLNYRGVSGIAPS